jgi:hypothetical protein
MDENKSLEELMERAPLFYSTRKTFREGWSFEKDFIKVVYAAFPDTNIIYTRTFPDDDDTPVPEEVLEYIVTLEKDGQVVKEIGIWHWYEKQADEVLAFVNTLCEEFDIKKRWLYLPQGKDYEDETQNWIFIEPEKLGIINQKRGIEEEVDNLGYYSSLLPSSDDMFPDDTATVDDFPF